MKFGIKPPLGLIVGLVILVLSSLFGCTNIGKTEYFNYEINEGNIVYSLEYPVGFEIATYDYENEFNKYSTFIKNKFGEKGYSIISINLFQKGEVVPNANSLLESSIDADKNGCETLRIITQYTSQINGIDTEIINVACSGASGDSETTYYSFDIVEWSAYFDYVGYAWVINLTYPSDYSKQAKADFDHILQTFKILD